MTNRAFERLERYSSVPPPWPAPPDLDASADDKLAYVIQLATVASSTVIDQHQYRQDALAAHYALRDEISALREEVRQLRAELARLRGAE